LSARLHGIGEPGPPGFAPFQDLLGGANGSAKLRDRVLKEAAKAPGEGTSMKAVRLPPHSAKKETSTMVASPRRVEQELGPSVRVPARTERTFMAYDPNNPNRVDPNRRVVRDTKGLSGAMIAGIMLAIALGIGVLFYAMNRDDRAASTTTSPPATTGQSQKAPAPAPSNPAPAPKAQ